MLIDYAIIDRLWSDVHDWILELGVEDYQLTNEKIYWEIQLEIKMTR